MAVYCGVCGERIGDATERYPDFPVSDFFKAGWDTRTAGRADARIGDTCQSCFTTLARIVAAAATRIVAKNKKRVDERKAEIATMRERTARQIKALEGRPLIDWPCMKYSGVRCTHPECQP